MQYIFCHFTYVEGIWSIFCTHIDNHLRPSIHCPACPGAAMNPTLTMPTPPNVMLTWSPPATSADWPLRYRVESSDGREIAASLTTPSVVVEGLNHLTQYTVNIITFTNSSTCSNASVTYTFTTGQSESVHVVHV